MAWDRFRDRFSAFTERTAQDHPEHPALGELLDVGAIAAAADAEAWGALACEVLLHLGRHEHPLVDSILLRLEGNAEHFDTAILHQQVAVGRFRYANLFFFEGDNAAAKALYTEILGTASPEWDVYASMLNNRGITSHRMRDYASAMADYAAVIDSPHATDEARACSLNNRADIYDASDDPLDAQRAIADRSAVLALTETTFNRRYIALARRSEALRHLGDFEAALHDLATIVATPDIALEQKMAARLRRAEILVDQGKALLAVDDLTMIGESLRNFDGVAERARELAETMNDALGRAQRSAVPDGRQGPDVGA